MEPQVVPNTELGTLVTSTSRSARPASDRRSPAGALPSRSRTDAPRDGPGGRRGQPPPGGPSRVGYVPSSSARGASGPGGPVTSQPPGRSARPGDPQVPSSSGRTPVSLCAAERDGAGRAGQGAPSPSPRTARVRSSSAAASARIRRGARPSSCRARSRRAAASPAAASACAGRSPPLSRPRRPPRAPSAPGDPGAGRAVAVVGVVVGARAGARVAVRPARPAPRTAAATSLQDMATKLEAVALHKVEFCQEGEAFTSRGGKGGKKEGGDPPTIPTRPTRLCASPSTESGRALCLAC